MQGNVPNTLLQFCFSSLVHTEGVESNSTTPDEVAGNRVRNEKAFWNVDSMGKRIEDGEEYVREDFTTTTDRERSKNKNPGEQRRGVAFAPMNVCEGEVRIIMRVRYRCADVDSRFKGSHLIALTQGYSNILCK